MDFGHDIETRVKYLDGGNYYKPVLLRPPAYTASTTGG